MDKPDRSYLVAIKQHRVTKQWAVFVSLEGGKGVMRTRACDTLEEAESLVPTVLDELRQIIEASGSECTIRKEWFQ